ncbi:uncharacterized protein V1518DRAFT_418050 [Limtongia smithiae]|uniref:uncharacterized protein n=1 Tax=Limtongia smithiae TaxID=1125753 RepID=UPI0034CE2821
MIASHSSFHGLLDPAAPGAVLRNRVVRSASASENRAVPNSAATSLTRRDTMLNDLQTQPLIASESVASALTPPPSRENDLPAPVAERPDRVGVERSLVPSTQLLNASQIRVQLSPLASPQLPTDLAATTRSNFDRDALIQRMLIGQGVLRSSRTPATCLAPRVDLVDRPVLQGATVADVSTRVSGRKRKNPVPKSGNSPPITSQASPKQAILHRENTRENADGYQEYKIFAYLPLAFALFPAFCGVVFSHGSVVVNDFLVLCLLAGYLYWLVQIPHMWYRNAREQALAAGLYSPLIRNDAGKQDRKTAANANLGRWEFCSLLFCFIGPALGGTLLYYLRTGLSTPISNFNITLFLLAAFMRASGVLLEYVDRWSRRLYERATSLEPSRAEALEDNFVKLRCEIERLDGLVGFVVQESSSKFRPDIDSLTRAMRRYERNQMLMADDFMTQLHDVKAEVRKTVLQLKQTVDTSRPKVEKTDMRSATSTTMSGYNVLHPTMVPLFLDVRKLAIMSYVFWVFYVPFRVASKIVHAPWKIKRKISARFAVVKQRAMRDVAGVSL